MTSSTLDADLKGNNFRRPIHPQSFIAVAFIFSELERGLPQPPPDLRSKKSSVSVGLKGLHDEDFAVLGQFCPKIIT